MTEPLAFIDLAAQQRRIKADLDRRIAEVLAHGAYILGPEVSELEQRLSAFCGAPEAVACASGTDALLLALLAMGVGPGDVVFCPAFTFAATAEVMPMIGAVPYFVDVDPESFNIAPESLARSIAAAQDDGLPIVGAITVDLFGRPADYDVIEPLLQEQSLWMICDGAQSFGARHNNRRVGAIGDIATTSFFPAKPLGCYGDGGAIFTANAERAALIRSLRAHGKGAHKYDHARIGWSSRLDTVQAAILLAKLDVFESEILARQQVAERYAAGLAVCRPKLAIPDMSTTTALSVWAQYTLILAAELDREAFRAELSAAGVPSAIYYPKALHDQAPYAAFPRDPDGLAVSEMLAERVVSLPMHPYLEAEPQRRVIEAVRAAVGL